MKSAITTLNDGILFCKKFLRDNPNLEQKEIDLKMKQIKEHEDAIEIIKKKLRILEIFS